MQQITRSSETATAARHDASDIVPGRPTNSWRGDQYPSVITITTKISPIIRRTFACCRYYVGFWRIRVTNQL